MPCRLLPRRMPAPLALAPIVLWHVACGPWSAPRPATSPHELQSGTRGSAGAASQPTTQPTTQPASRPSAAPSSRPASEQPPASRPALASSERWDRDAHGPSPHEVHHAGRGRFTLPYPLTHIMKRIGKCRRGRRGHVAIDIAGAGPHAGLGTPVRAVAASRVTYVGDARTDPAKHGRLDKRPGTVTRRRRELPRSLEVPGYGRVLFFTRDYGRARSGHMLITKIVGGRLDGYAVRYIHLGAIHPRIRVGTRLAAGDELGLMGGTAVQNDLPHLHIDLWNRRGRRVDIGPLLGLRRVRIACPRRKRRRGKRRGRRARSKRPSRARSTPR